MELDNREIAFLTWFALIAGTIVRKTRRSDVLRNLLCVLIKPPILYLLCVLACYVAVCIWLLSIPGWWQWSNLKTSLLWVGGFALVAAFNYEKAGAGKAYFRATMLEAIGLTVLLSFIASSHTYGLLAELLIAFLLIVLVAAAAVSERDARLKSVHTLATVLLALLALLMLGNSIYHIITSFGHFATSHTAREFALPMLLTAMFLPFLYGLYVYITYHSIFNSFNSSIKNPTLHSYARLRLITGFGLDTAGLEKWRRHVVIFEPKDKGDIDASIREIKQVRRRERHPHRVPPPLGWLPNHATQFLVSAGLPTNDYHRTHEGWWASSRYLNIGNAIPSCNIAYYVEGEEFVVTKLKLVLSISAPDEANRAYEHFSQIISALANAAIPGALRNNKELELHCDDAPLLVNGYALALRRIEWPNGIPGGHELAFTIEVYDALASTTNS